MNTVETLVDVEGGPIKKGKIDDNIIMDNLPDSRLPSSQSSSDSNSEDVVICPVTEKWVGRYNFKFQFVKSPSHAFEVSFKIFVFIGI